MWSVRSNKLAEIAGLRCTVARDQRAATVHEIFLAMQNDAEFRTFFSAQLAGVSYPAYRWETPGVTKETLDRPFEFVVLESAGLERAADPQAFAEHFQPEKSIVSFANLNNDAVMIVPCPAGDLSAYTHLASFVRRAPDTQRHALWQRVAEEAMRRIGAKPVWLSTAGAGVAWLHVRLDDRPKYYAYAPFRQFR